MQKKSERLFRIFKRLKDHPQTVDELFRWCKSHNIPVSLRTIYRYLEELSTSSPENGFTVISEGFGIRDLKWKVIPNKDNHATLLGDALSGFHIISQLSGANNMSVGNVDATEMTIDVFRSISTADLKISTLLSNLVVTNWGRAMYSEKDRSLMAIALNAIDEKFKVELRLLKQLQAEEPIKGVRKWKLYALVFHRGSIFIASSMDQSSNLYFIDLESILSIKPTKQKFNKVISRSAINEQLMKRFGITRHDGPVYKIKLAFHPSDDKMETGFLNPFIQKRIWHPNQRFSKDASGRYLVLEFDSQLNRELVGWIMMWMDHIKILEPVQLIQIVKSKLKAIQDIMDGSEPKFNTPSHF
jgi:predicted DNA-binding transcriptional regulator YafY